jgi:hypothetical protein
MTVTKQSPIATWPNPKGKGETTLYEVTAVDEHGEPITDKLRSFAELEIGKLDIYEVEPYSHPQHGDSLTVHRPRSNTSQRVAALEKVVNDLANRVAALEEGDNKVVLRRGGRAGFQGSFGGSE